MLFTKPLTPKSHLLCRWATFSRTSSRSSSTSLCHIQKNSRIPVSSIIQLSRSCHNRISLPFASGFKVIGSPKFAFEHLGVRSLRVSAAGGSGGKDGGGFGGGSGNGSSGGGDGSTGGGAGGSNWSFLSWYLSLLARYPVATKAVTSALLTLVGDLICQLVIDQVPSLDLKRTSIFTLLGLVLVGPTLHFWYLSLSKLVTRPGASGAFLRLLLDQFLFAPTFIGIFLSTLMTLEGRPSEVIPKLQQEWFSSVLANWQLWVPFQFLNFRFVPQQFQVLAANFVALIWNVILSYKAHKEVIAK